MLHEAAGIDLRSLAAFRIGAALALMWDLVLSFQSVTAFYTDEGFLPLALVSKFTDSPWLWSVHVWSGSWGWQIALLVLQLIATLCLLVGYRAQLAMFLCWALMCSLQVRNPTILNSGDVVLRLFCFWGLFLPLGARWSVDAWRTGPAARETQDRVTSTASLAILVQLVLVYVMGTIEKNGDEWVKDGTAVYYALSLDQFVTPAGRLLLNYPELCRVMTFGTWWLEMIVPFCIFVPWRNDVWRLVAVVAFWSLHFSLGICLRLGPFPLIMMTGWLLCVPGWVWERMFGRNRAGQQSEPASEAAMKPEPSWMRRRVTRVFVVVCLVYAVLWNFRSVYGQSWNRWFPPWVNPFGYVLQLQQYWTMFAPRPSTDDGWVVMEAVLADDSRVDLLREGRPVSFEKPPVISAEFKDGKWQKIILNLWRSPYEEMRAPFGNYLAFQWNGSHPAARQIKGWTLWYMREDTLPDSTNPPRKIEMLSVGSP